MFIQFIKFFTTVLSFSLILGLAPIYQNQFQEINQIRFIFSLIGIIFGYFIGMNFPLLIEEPNSTDMILVSKILEILSTVISFIGFILISIWIYNQWDILALLFLKRFSVKGPFIYEQIILLLFICLALYLIVQVHKKSLKYNETWLPSWVVIILLSKIKPKTIYFSFKPHDEAAKRASKLIIKDFLAPYHFQSEFIISWKSTEEDLKDNYDFFIRIRQEIFPLTSFSILDKNQIGIKYEAIHARNLTRIIISKLCLLMIKDS